MHKILLLMHNTAQIIIMWSKALKKENLCFVFLFVLGVLSSVLYLPHPFTAKAQLEHLCRVRYIASPSNWKLEVFFPPNSPFKSFWAWGLFPQRGFSGRSDTKTLPLIDSNYILSPASPHLPGLMVKAHCDHSKEILLCADIYQVTTRSGQVFDTPAFAGNYQVVLQVTGSAHFKGLWWSSSLTCLSFFSMFFKGASGILILILCFSWSNLGGISFAI